MISEGVFAALAVVALFAPMAAADGAELRASVDALEADLRQRLGPAAHRRNYTCDLLATRDYEHHLHIVQVIEQDQLSTALALVLSLLETSGGACEQHGAFRFHIVVPEDDRELIERRLGPRRPSWPQLNNAIRVHGFDPSRVLPFFSGTRHITKGSSSAVRRRRVFRHATSPDTECHELQCMLNGRTFESCSHR